MKFNNKYILLIIFLFYSSIFLSSKEKFIIKVACSEGYPKSFVSKDGDEILGMIPDIIIALNKISNDIEFVIYDLIPVKRIYSLMEQGIIHAHFITNISKERLKIATASKLPLIVVEYRIAVLKDDDVVINSFDDIRKLGNDGVILAKHGTASTQFLKKEKGLIIDSTSKRNIDNLKKLLNNRGRFVYYHTIGLKSGIDALKAEDKIKILPTVLSKKHQGALFSKKLPDEIVKKINEAIEELTNSGELKMIIDKYRY